ncbi:MAG: hypothetical protein OXF46_06800 [Rhodobacteraceae bacterium]|nr:hypothetical protein [Paracoccaceae bacterium]
MNNDDEPNESDNSSERESDDETTEFIKLTNEEIAKKKGESELEDSKQKRSHRDYAIVICITVLVLMTFLLLYVVNCIFLADENTRFEAPFQIVAYVAPITSITVVTVTLLIGAFRVDKDQSKDAISTLSKPLPFISN